MVLKPETPINPINRLFIMANGLGYMSRGPGSGVTWSKGEHSTALASATDATIQELERDNKRDCGDFATLWEAHYSHFSQAVLSLLQEALDSMFHKAELWLANQSPLPQSELRDVDVQRIQTI
ncbi:hypothetical protein SASPL_128552 [Salvia splendens]|uniref:Uncharacterized protein n=1 Tax=Salvia splendens TaxID=180675 RepID=A0A8X8XFG9_SALSN|nr:hypothetical protein SASPL_128552 [Salvia splendens]